MQFLDATRPHKNNSRLISWNSSFWDTDCSHLIRVNQCIHRKGSFAGDLWRTLSHTDWMGCWWSCRLFYHQSGSPSAEDQSSRTSPAKESKEIHLMYYTVTAIDNRYCNLIKGIIWALKNTKTIKFNNSLNLYKYNYSTSDSIYHYFFFK